MRLWGVLHDIEADLAPHLYALRQQIRGMSDRKLARQVWAARSRLAYHDLAEPGFGDARGWMRQTRQEERYRLTCELAVLEAEYRRRPTAVRWPSGLA